MKELTFFINVGNLVISIDISKVTDDPVRNVLHQQLTTYYSSELVPKPKSPPDFTIYFIAEEEYRFVKEDTLNNGIRYFLETFVLNEHEAYVHYHTGIAQYQFFLKMILQSLLGRHQGFILHASAIIDGDNAHLFLGPNGIGKSTIVENISSSFTPFADDMVIVRKRKKIWEAHQLPLEKKRYNAPAMHGKRVRTLCYLQQSKASKMTSLSPVTASKKLLEQLIKNGATEQNIKALLSFLPDVDHFLFETLLDTQVSDVRKLVRRYR